MVRLFRPDVPVSRSDAHKSVGLLRGTLRPDGDPYRVISHSTPAPHDTFHFLFAFLSFVRFSLSFSRAPVFL
jgi:hypothetical protein